MERRELIDRLRNAGESEELGQEYTASTLQADPVEGNMSRFHDYFEHSDDEEEPSESRHPFKDWDPQILDLQDRGSSFDEEQELFVRTGEEISPYYDDEYEEMQKEAQGQGLDPLPDRLVVCIVLKGVLDHVILPKTFV
jgi:hypothetical protein